MMNYPASYTLLGQEEMLAQTGAGPLEIFDRVIGATFQAQFLGSVRTVVWNCLQQKSLQPTVDWAKDLWEMSLLNKLVFLYGGFRVGQTVVDYWNK